jgi:hypothetical protein
MRRRHKKYQKNSKKVLVTALSIVSHVAAIVGAIVAIADTLHRW